MRILTAYSRPLVCVLVLAAAFITLDSANGQEQGMTPQEHMKKLIGTWTATRVNVEGESTLHTYQIMEGDKEGEFKHLWRVSGDKENGDSLWEGRFEVTPASRKTLAVNYIENKRVLPEDKAHDWRPFGLSYVAQVVGDQLYAQTDLDSEGWIWIRENSGMNTQGAKQLEALAPLLETYSGKSENKGSRGYGIEGSRQTVTSTGTTTASGTVIVHEWTSLPEGASADEAFEARGIYSYNPMEKKIVKQFQTSTGMHMSGVLVSAQDGKLLWERTAEGPTGTVHEFCQFDFSEPGVFRHRILKRTLNGVPVDSEERDIVLQKVESSE